MAKFITIIRGNPKKKPRPIKFYYQCVCVAESTLRCGERACVHRFDGINGSNVHDLTSANAFPQRPTRTVALTNGSFEARSGHGHNYGTMLEGFVAAPTTGRYTFAVDSDDSSEVWVSSTPNALDQDMVKVVEQTCCVKVEGTSSVAWVAGEMQAF